MIRAPQTPPVDCDVCQAEITASVAGFLDCEVVDLHDGTPPKDVCATCRSKPLSVIFPHILERKQGHPMRKAPPAPDAGVELEETDEATTDEGAEKK